MMFWRPNSSLAPARPSRDQIMPCEAIAAVDSQRAPVESMSEADLNAPFAVWNEEREVMRAH
jgi:hypothetical protein